MSGGGAKDVAPAMRVHVAGDLVFRALHQIQADRAEATDALFLTELTDLVAKVGALALDAGLLDPKLSEGAAKMFESMADFGALVREHLTNRSVDEQGAAEVAELMEALRLLDEDDGN